MSAMLNTGIVEGGFALAVHGGAGAARAEFEDAVFHAGLRRALSAGYAVLEAGGGALDAVTQTVVALEDDPLFNAGRGSVYTAAGTQEMDAAVMDGRDRRAGAVAAINGPKNPVLAARAVMEHSPHVLLVGDGALAFCRAQGLAFAEPAYFFSEVRRRELQQMAEPPPGTVGAVARDRAGNLAAATSTGGTGGKLPGRVGDTPIIGAGTFADNATCAVSATGHGEVFIRYAAAFEISARLGYRGERLEDAAAAVVARLAGVGGPGGLVAVDREGRLALPFNCERMSRGWVRQDGVMRTAICDEPWREG